MEEALGGGQESRKEVMFLLFASVADVAEDSGKLAVFSVVLVVS